MFSTFDQQFRPTSTHGLSKHGELSVEGGRALQHASSSVAPVPRTNTISNFKPVPPVPRPRQWASMKHMACWYWANDSCRYSAAQCDYAHYLTGTLSERPYPPAKGFPAMAGKNLTHAQSELGKQEQRAPQAGEAGIRQAQVALGAAVNSQGGDSGIPNGFKNFEVLLTKRAPNGVVRDIDNIRPWAGILHPNGESLWGRSEPILSEAPKTKKLSPLAEPFKPRSSACPKAELGSFLRAGIPTPPEPPQPAHRNPGIIGQYVLQPPKEPLHQDIHRGMTGQIRSRALPEPLYPTQNTGSIIRHKSPTRQLIHTERNCDPSPPEAYMYKTTADFMARQRANADNPVYRSKRLAFYLSGSR